MSPVVTNGNLTDPTATVGESDHHLEHALRALETGLNVRRIKSAKINDPMPILLHDQKWLKYPLSASSFVFCNRNRRRLKEIDVSQLLEVRQGYGTDGLHRAAKKYRFQVAAPESRCFSIVVKHPKFVCKSIDFVADTEEHRDYCVKTLQHLIDKGNHCISFNEKEWLLKNFRAADLNSSGEISFNELWKLLKTLNLQVPIDYARGVFDLTLKNSQSSQLKEEEFLKLFEALSDLPEYKKALLLANGDGQAFLNVQQLVRFLKEEQGFDEVDEKKAEAVITFCEPTADGKARKELTVSGFRRMLYFRWGGIIKPNHENIFMDMTQPLFNYFIYSSHNTYLTGIQVRGEATVEGYISALKQGARLLELDVFDGESEPIITHKHTFVKPITLRNALRSIKRYAFQTSPYPVILTIENHTGHVQQKIMAEIFEEILGDSLYRPPPNAGEIPLPSPHDLRNRFLLRGKTKPGQTESLAEGEEHDGTDSAKQTPREPLDPGVSRLIALPSVKLGSNIYQDIQDHPMDGSASLSESKVNSLMTANAPIYSYTASRLVKSYPRGIRQDSSNMNPLPSLLCGIQCIAMNFQTADEDYDIVKGLFSINGRSGYVLKPKVLRDGIDPRQSTDVKYKLCIGVICGQYFPKADPQGSDIVDPYVSIEVFGTHRDACKSRTRAIKNNGFNPVWNESFEFALTCPELAIVRFCVKDFDSTSAHDFVGEFSIPVESVRSGYSIIRLNTGIDHTTDEAASLLIRVAFDDA